MMILRMVYDIWFTTLVSIKSSKMLISWAYRRDITNKNPRSNFILIGDTTMSHGISVYQHQSIAFVVCHFDFDLSNHDTPIGNQIFSIFLAVTNPSVHIYISYIYMIYIYDIYIWYIYMLYIYVKISYIYMIFIYMYTYIYGIYMIYTYIYMIYIYDIYIYIHNIFTYIYIYIYDIYIYIICTHTHIYHIGLFTCMIYT